MKAPSAANPIAVRVNHATIRACAGGEAMAIFATAIARIAA